MEVADELRRAVGQRVTLELSPQVAGRPEVTGRVLGVLEALDGLSVVIEPDGAAPGASQTYHYHYVLAVKPAP
jgi:hypothetical protein